MSDRRQFPRHFAPALVALALMFATGTGAQAASADTPPAQENAEQAQDLSSHNYFTRIEKLLAEAEAAYEAGDKDAATEALIEAYLENFEYLEAPLGAVDHDAMEALEMTLRENLPALVAQGVPAEAFEVAVDDALTHLDQAEALLP
ncbi:MAG TPA: hypothetical protein VF171_01990 [Trueperaceae bacterium]